MFYFLGGWWEIWNDLLSECTQRNEHLCCRFLFGEFETYFVAKLFQSKDFFQTCRFLESCRSCQGYPMPRQQFDRYTVLSAAQDKVNFMVRGMGMMLGHVDFYFGKHVFSMLNKLKSLNLFLCFCCLVFFLAVFCGWRVVRNSWKAGFFRNQLNQRWATWSLDLKKSSC